MLPGVACISALVSFAAFSSALACSMSDRGTWLGAQVRVRVRVSQVRVRVRVRVRG
jgi:hypothetical protein